ncbi:hypothetical protein Tco_0688133 [Tanacetum coccineum]
MTQGIWNAPTQRVTEKQVSRVNSISMGMHPARYILKRAKALRVFAKQSRESKQEDQNTLARNKKVNQPSFDQCTNHQDKKKKQERSQKGDAFSPERQRDDISKKERKKERGIASKRNFIVSIQARVDKQGSSSKRRKARVVKQETASKSRQARGGKQESSSKSRQARVDKKETSGKQETAIDEKA